MKKRNIHILFILVFTFVVGSLSACTKTTEKEAPESPKTSAPETKASEVTSEKPAENKAPETKTAGEKIYREALYVDAQTANIHTLGLNYDGIVADYCTGFLYREMPNTEGTKAEFFPELAKDKPVQMDDKGLIWQIKLAEGAVWANGDKISADTFIYSWQKCLDPTMFNQNGSRLANLYIVIENAADYLMQNQADAAKKDVPWEDVGIKKIDDYTLQITVTEPVQESDVMRHFNARHSMPVYEPYYEAGMNASKTVTNYGTELSNFMSSGPFIFTSWTKGAERIYEKNPNSRLSDRVNIDKIVYRIVPDASTMLQLFENGEIDVCWLDVDTLPKYEEDPRLHILPATLIFHWEINRVNPDQPIYNDPDFRRALYYSMDRNVFAKLTACIPAPYYITPLSYIDQENGEFYRDTPEAQAIVPENDGYNPELAKEYFQKAMEKAKLDTITLKVLYEDTGFVLKVMAEYWQQDVNKIFDGKMKLEMVTMPDQQKTEVMRDWKNNPSGYEIGGHAFSNRDSVFYPWMPFRNYTQGFQRYMNYGNTKFDAMYDEIIKPEVKFNKDKLLPALVEMEKEFIDDVLNLPTVQAVDYVLFSERVILPSAKPFPVIDFGEIFADIDMTK